MTFWELAYTSRLLLHFLVKSNHSDFRLTQANCPAVARMLKGQILAIILYTACLTVKGQSEQAFLACDGGDMPRLSMNDTRVVGRLENRIFLGSTQYVTVFDGDNFFNEYFGVCYGTGASNCYKTNTDRENCDNFIRAVVDLGNNSSILVCGTNAKLSQCDNCTLTGSELSCNFTENFPPQDLPYNPAAADNVGYTSCTTSNEVGTEVFQYMKNHNATFLYHDDIFYYGLVKSDSDEKSIIGRADKYRDDKVITRTDSDKMVATEAHFVGKPFVNGDYVYFLFREPAQEFASLSAGQAPSIKTYYSRIARICKDDVGVPVSSTQTLTSFLKQRLVCSIRTEDSTFYYNDIQDFALSDDGTTIHAIFTNERNAAPQSALCNFTLTSIDDTFDNGDFFGADGVSNTNDLWRKNNGAAISPRPGLNCSNPNTAHTDFERDYNLMNDPAVGTVQFFLVGDRFSNLKMTSESGTEVIISSERGCLYKAEVHVEGITERDLGDPCQDPVVSRPIKDLELTENGYLVTTDEDVYVLSSCSEPTPPPPTPTPTPPPSMSPPGGDYQVPPNSVFKIIYGTVENGEPGIIYINNGKEITDSNNAYRLLKNESLDCTRSLVHLSILILDVTEVTFSVSNLNYLIKPYAAYTDNEATQRCTEWEVAEQVYTSLNNETTCGSATSEDKGSFSSNILLDAKQVQNCNTCAYNDCTYKACTHSNKYIYGCSP